MAKKFNAKIFIYLMIVIFFLYAFLGSKGNLVENLEIPIAVGYDLGTKIEKDVIYNIPISSYLFENGETVDSETLTGEASTIGETRENRQLKASKTFLLGLERIFLFNEQACEYSLNPIIDILLSNPQINDRALVAVCKEKSEDILKLNIKGYSNSAEFIEGLVKNAKQFNFFPEQNKLMDIFVRLDAEGRSTLLPYIELKDETIKLTGLAIFKKDKMVLKTDIEEGKIINLLKENKVKGMLTIQDSSKNYINYYAESKRKVKCSKEDGKLKFIIDLSLNGTIVNNTLYLNLINNPKILKAFTKNMEEGLKEKCQSFINDKIKKEYKIDVLDLGRVAAAKYGRETGTDWDKAISQALIEVNVKVKVDTEGRGSYQLISEE
ncbi:Ger(x)C family spore germination protein [Clostridium sp. PL3]|uniref:Ger(X)C family spore germination protein n=1 Tax=Clostridium thailandense TaxID=2794346 RepID=A0A949WQB8_9CLOT|nr:Ger(x)C family spore germination protein [Clostridium thailandense]MBV7272556.1 Ger(x)C family spore germination protein [Clostridium thailandense]